MATVNPTSRGGDFGRGTTTATVVTAAADSVIATLKIPLGARFLYFQVKNSHATVAFDQFTLKRRPHASAAWETIADSAGDYTSPQLPILEVTGAPVTLAAAASTFIRMQVEATESVLILASGAAAASAADFHYEIGS